MHGLGHPPSQLWVDLMIQKTVHFDDTTADMLSLIQNSLNQFLHNASRELNQILACRP